MFSLVQYWQTPSTLRSFPFSHLQTYRAEFTDVTRFCSFCTSLLFWQANQLTDSWRLHIVYYSNDLCFNSWWFQWIYTSCLFMILDKFCLMWFFLRSKFYITSFCIFNTNILWQLNTYFCYWGLLGVHVILKMLLVSLKSNVLVSSFEE